MERTDVEEHLRLRLQARAADVTVEDAAAWDRLEGRLRRKRWERMVLAATGAAVLAGAVVAGAVVLQRPAPPTVVAGATTTASPDQPTSGPPGLPGLAPPRRVAGDRVEYKVTSVNGASYWISLPAGLPGHNDASVVPEAPVTVADAPRTPRQELTTATPRQVAEEACKRLTRDTGAACTPTAEGVQPLRSRARLTHWHAGTDETTTTVELGGWTLVLTGPDPGLAETIAAGIVWTIDHDGYVRLRGTDPRVRVDPAGAVLMLGATATGDLPVHISVRQGCQQAAGSGRSALKRQGDHFASWCVAPSYRVEALTSQAMGADLIAVLYDQLRILPAE